MDQRTSDELEIVARTREWVREHFLYMRPEWRLGIDDPLLRNGVIDSIGVVELVAWLSDAFSVRIDESELTERNLGSLGAIAAFVDRKRRDSGAGEAGRPRHVA